MPGMTPLLPPPSCEEGEEWLRGMVAESRAEEGPGGGG